ncbi:two-component system response regulator CreB [Agitococcus lubricus]|uniref:Two-component system catabolic regulation response regulator CreB n=1 Tax=Agitococcus lubricus TaxID=1077255 RepID=A0A2T5IZB3_9GAMM|nr:two-component system response regulator CreB [Agitococcus lubricus]PTQ89301.1 two-component system catabolic regulation response regulator CreB [Agitococcus lubricus]
MFKHILLVEDDEAIAQPLIYTLEREGWQVVWSPLASHVMPLLAQHEIDFIILDVGLPDGNGFDVCRQIRQHYNTPLLFLTARNEEVERIIGLEIGADDYCAKPFSPRELISRIRVIWRRVAEKVITPPIVSNSTPQVWLYQPEKMQIHYYGQALNLTRYEYRLLEVLIRQPERVLSRQQLMQAAWEYPDHSLERTIDTHIKALRHKLKMIHDEDVIVTHRGVGYSLIKK